MLPQSAQDPRGRRLESWKEIAAHLGRDVRTAQRWEQHEGLPVHRLQHSRQGSIYAFAEELDAWRNAKEPAAPGAESKGRPVPARPRTVWLAVLILCAALVGSARWAWHSPVTGTTAHTRHRIESIAVLPLANFSGDPQQDYLADGMTEALIARLSTLRSLRVISRTSVMQFKSGQQSIPAIARKLGVDGIVEASVMRADRRIRVTARLIRADTEAPLWSSTFDRELSDILALQSDISQAIASHIEVAISGDEQTRLEARRTVTPDVYEAFLRGQFLLNKRTVATSEEAARLFEAAIASDPSFAPAYAGLARTHMFRSTIYLGGASPADTLPRVATAAQRVLELDADLPDGHSLMAYVAQRKWQWAQAEAGYRRAVALRPSDTAALSGLADLLACLGRFDESLGLSRLVRDLDPIAPGATRNLAVNLFFARRFDDALRELQNLDALKPDDPWTLWYLGLAFNAVSRYDDAIRTLERSVSLQRNPGALGSLAVAYSRAGRRTDARRVLGELTRDARTRYIPPSSFVEAHTGLGDFDQAFQAMERAYAEHSNFVRILKVNPVVDPLRKDPRFAEYLRRIGLE